MQLVWIFFKYQQLYFIISMDFFISYPRQGNVKFMTVLSICQQDQANTIG